MEGVERIIDTRSRI